MRNTLKEIYQLANIMSYEDWREEISYRIKKKLRYYKTSEILKDLNDKL
jgi:hypothetical protein